MPRKPLPPSPFCEAVTTFRKPWMQDVCPNVHATPSAFNGDVNVRQYRVTIELIDEPVEVIHARLRELWVTCKTDRMRGPIEKEAARYGLTLDRADFGARVRT